MMKVLRFRRIERDPFQWTSKIKISVVFGIISFGTGILLLFAASPQVAVYRLIHQGCDFPDRPGGGPSPEECFESRMFVVAGAFGIMAGLVLIASFGTVCYQHFIFWIGFHVAALLCSLTSLFMLLYMTIAKFREKAHEYTFVLGTLGMACFWSLVSSGVFIGLTILSPNPKYEFFKIPSKFGCLRKRKPHLYQNPAQPNQAPVDNQQVDPKAAPNKNQVAATPTPIPKLSPKPKA